MDGILLVPPDRGTIIGRALWKPRYIVVDSAIETKRRIQNHRNPQPPGTSSSSTNTPATSQPLASQPTQRAATPADSATRTPESMLLSIYKNKGDLEPVQQHPISSITDCQVQMLAHRKQGPILPTLVINLSPDPATDKLRKRRSSRTAGLITSKEAPPSTLLFRPGEDNHKHYLLEWSRFIQTLLLQLGTNTPISSGPLSPVTPASPTFVNPFATGQKDSGSPGAQHPGDGGRNASRLNSNGSVSHKGSSYASTHTQRKDGDRDRPTTYSDSPSLRSRRSDLSHTSSTLPPHIANSGYSTTGTTGSNHYNTPFLQNRPIADLPSPATTINEFPTEFSEGFHAAQGRSSALPSPPRGRESLGIASGEPLSIGSALHTSATTSALVNASTSPKPRETILDRAFQMRLVPGSQRDSIPGEEKLSSLARFEALMREAEDRKRLRQGIAVSDIRRSATTALVGRPGRSNSFQHQPADQPKSGWDLDEDSDDGSMPSGAEDDDGLDADRDKPKLADGGLASDGDDDAGASEHARYAASRLRSGRRANSSSVHPSAMSSDVDIAPNALRALDFIAASNGSRRAHAMAPDTAGIAHDFEAVPNASRVRGIPNYDAQALRALDSGGYDDGPDALRPHTGYSSRNRPSFGQRTHSQPQLAALNIANFASMGLSDNKSTRRSTKPPPRHSQQQLPPASRSGEASRSRHLVSSPCAKVDEVNTPPSAPSPIKLAADRLSAQSAKRLSLNDITQRPSGSTSSLLLGQANATDEPGNGMNSPGSLEPAPAHSQHQPGQQQGAYAVFKNENPAISNLTSHNRQGSGASPPRPERYGWRNSVNVVTSEGGFL